MSDDRCPNCRAPILASPTGRPSHCVFCKQPLAPPHSAPSPTPSARPGWSPASPPPPVGDPASANPPNASLRPVTWTTTQRPDTRLASGGLALALVALALAGAVWFRGRATPDKPAATAPMPLAGANGPAMRGATSVPTVPGPKPTAVDVAPAAEPTLRLVASREATTRIGGRFFLVTVDNPGTIPVEGASATATGYASDGRSLVSQPGYAVRDRLEPGESTVLLVLVAHPPAEAVRFEVTANPPRAASGPVRELPLDVVDVVERATSGTFHDLDGALVNHTGRPVRFAKVLAIGRDAAGAPCAFADGYARPSDLPVDGRAPFSLTVGTFEIERPARWEVVGLGRGE